MCTERPNIGEFARKLTVSQKPSQNTFTIRVEYNILPILFRLAEENKSLETNAAISIQRVYRGGKKRDFFANKHRNATIVQRAFRGHCSRNRIKYMKAREAENRNILLFHSFALILQKSFRGYYSRKYRSSHFKRKEFIAKIATTAARIRDMQYEYSIQQALVILMILRLYCSMPV